MLRYWNGTSWTEQRRLWPAWSIDSSRDPAVTEKLTTPAGGVTTGVASVPGRMSSPEGNTPVGSQTGAGSGGSAGPGQGGGDDGNGGDESSGPPTGSRRKWWLVGGIAALAAILVVVAGEAFRPASPGPRVLVDARFVQQANQACANTLPGLRPPATGPFGSTVTPTQAADGIDRAADGLDALAGRLAALPAADVDRSHIDGWLAGWGRYTALGRQYAAFLRQHGNGQPPDPLIRDSRHEASLEARFAMANGLKRCTFSFTPQPDPQNGF